MVELKIQGKRETKKKPKKVSKSKLKKVKNPLRPSAPQSVDVWDDKDKVKTNHFSIGILKYEHNKEVFREYYFGKMVPRWVPKIIKGEYKGEQQILIPHIVTSKNRAIEINDGLTSDFKVQFTEPHSECEDHWSLNKIKNYIDYNNTALIKDYKPPTLKEVFDRIYKLYKKHCFFNHEEEYWVRTIWDIGTYLTPLFHQYPYLNLWGLRGCGKTRAMKVSSLLSFNGCILIDPSESTLFRLTSLAKCTIYLDEAESLFQTIGKVKVVDKRVELLNNGYSNEGFVIRQEKDPITGKFIGKKYSAYCPKQIGSIRGIEGALKDRCIDTVMIRPYNGVRYDDEPLNIPGNEFWNVRNMLYELAFSIWSEVEWDYNKFDNESVPLKNRPLQKWKPILVLSRLLVKQINGDLSSKSGTNEANEGGRDGKEEKELIKYIQKCENLNTMDLIGEGTREQIVLEKFIILSQTRLGQPIYIKDIKELCAEDGLTIYPKTIGLMLDRLGFAKYKKRKNDGTLYDVKKETILRILQPLGFDSFASLTTLPTQTTLHIDDKDTITINEEKVKDEENKV